MKGKQVNKLSLYLTIALALALCACKNDAVFEDQADFENGIWREGNPVSFQFKIADASKPYTMDMHIRSSQEYTYHNLYFRYYLKNAQGDILQESLENRLLFDSKTGEPLGAGIGSIKELTFPLIESYTFADTGWYEIEFRQYMRIAELEGIWSVGSSLYPIEGQE